MLTQIQGLHHVTSMASDARANNAFFTGTLGLRRVKKTVNFDAPDVYHLYYGDERGTPGSVMTYFPFPNIGPRANAAPARSARPCSRCRRGRCGFWRSARPGQSAGSRTSFGESELRFAGPDGDELALVEVEDGREPWTGGGVPDEAAIRGFHGVSLRLRDAGATAELLRFMGYEAAEQAGARHPLPASASGNGADVIDVETMPVAGAPTPAPARCTTSPSRSTTARRSSRCARR